MDIKIIVATHKEYPMPNDPLYLSVQAGAASHQRLPYTGDDSGDSISGKNDIYCELTALYWAWKNLPEDAIGLCHYRRYFREPRQKQILTEKTLQELLREVPVILPNKRNYFIETGESQFVHAHGAENLDALKHVLAENAPGYLDAFEKSMSRTAGHRFNMMIMRREQLNAYCSWLFGILFETERRLGTVPPRMMGFLSERLIDAWIETERISYRELPAFQTEKTNWVKKGGAFLLRKIRGR